MKNLSTEDIKFLSTLVDASKIKLQIHDHKRNEILIYADYCTATLINTVKKRHNFDFVCVGKSLIKDTLLILFEEARK